MHRKVAYKIIQSFFKYYEKHTFQTPIKMNDGLQDYAITVYKDL